MRTLLLAAAPTLALGGAAHADEAYDACTTKAENGMGMQDCGLEYVHRAETELTAAWKHAYASVMPSRRQALLDEQRAWIKFKDKSCGFYADDYGSNGREISAPLCLARVIEDRTKELIDIGNGMTP